MTSLSENDQKNEVNIDSKPYANENEQLLLPNDDLKSIPTVIQEWEILVEFDFQLLFIIDQHMMIKNKKR